MFHRDKIIHKGHRRTPWSSEVPQVSQSISFDDVKSVNSCPNNIILGRPRSGERLTQLMHLINEGDFVKAQSRCVYYPKEASMPCIVNGCKMLPIHLLFQVVESEDTHDSEVNKEKAKRNVFDCLLMMCPIDEIHVVDQHSKVEAEDCLLNALINAHPEGLESKDSKGSLPLHTACKRSVRLSLILSLIDNYGDGLKITDGRARLPLHCVCKRKVHKRAVFSLVSKYPEATLIGDNNGRTPLDLLHEFGSSSIAEDVNNMIADKRFLSSSLYATVSKKKITMTAEPSSKLTNDKAEIMKQNTNIVEMRTQWANTLSSNKLQSDNRLIKGANKGDVTTCYKCGSLRKSKKRPPRGFVYVKKNCCNCGYYFYDLISCQENFINEAYEAGIIE